MDRGLLIEPESSVNIDISGNTFENNGYLGGVRVYPKGEFSVIGDITGNKFIGNEEYGFSIEPTHGYVPYTGNISHNTFDKNRDGDDAGGFYIEGILTGNVTHNIFTENGHRSVGGFRVTTMVGNITHNTFVNNTGSYRAGGFSIDVKFKGEITHNRFEGNSVSNGDPHWLQLGVAMYLGLENYHSAGRDLEPEAKISNNIFFNNTLGSSGGFAVCAKVPAVFANNLFMVVDELSEGVSLPAVGVFNPSIRFHNNIFSGMETAIYTEVPDLPITHNLFHNIGLDFVNQDGSGVGDDLDFWELFADGASNNIAAGLLLKDPAHGDFHPLADSPTIDAGTNQYAPADDFDGVARPIGGTADIGPYEYKQGSTGTTTTFLPEDVNQDGRVNIADLIVVARSLGTLAAENPRADVNGDGVVSIIDLTLVAGAFGETAAAPAAHVAAIENLAATEVAQWLQAAQNANLTDPVFQRGVEVLKHLLVLLVPKETMLLANYPNPFNPETWIPYQLANPAEVTLRIYAVDGSLIRTLSLGHKAIGIYQSRSRAAYWDGRNQIGEPVASGVYFYTFTAGDFTATRRMLILK